jgi:hypothetical protein
LVWLIPGERFGDSLLLQDCKCHAGHGQFRELLLELADLALGRGGLAAEGFGFIFVAFVFVHDRLAEAV